MRLIQIFSPCITSTPDRLTETRLCDWRRMGVTNTGSSTAPFGIIRWRRTALGEEWRSSGICIADGHWLTMKRMSRLEVTVTRTSLKVTTWFCSRLWDALDLIISCTPVRWAAEIVQTSGGQIDPKTFIVQDISSWRASTISMPDLLSIRCCLYFPIQKS
jgi:hypothetical protein